MNKASRKKEKLSRQRTKIRKARQNSVHDSFYEYTNISPSGNAFYDLKDDPRFTEILQHVDNSIPVDQTKDTRDKALNHLTKALIMMKMMEEKFEVKLD